MTRQRSLSSLDVTMDEVFKELLRLTRDESKANVQCFTCNGKCHHQSINSMWKVCNKKHATFEELDDIMKLVQADFDAVYKKHFKFLPLVRMPDKWECEYTIKCIFHMNDAHGNPVVILITTNGRVILFKPVKDEASMACWKVFQASQQTGKKVKIFFYKSPFKNVFYLSGCGAFEGIIEPVEAVDCNIM